MPSAAALTASSEVETPLRNDECSARTQTVADHTHPESDSVASIGSKLPTEALLVDSLELVLLGENKNILDVYAQYPALFADFSPSTPSVPSLNMGDMHSGILEISAAPATEMSANIHMTDIASEEDVWIQVQADSTPLYSFAPIDNAGFQVSESVSANLLQESSPWSGLAPTAAEPLSIAPAIGAQTWQTPQSSVTWDSYNESNIDPSLTWSSSHLGQLQDSAGIDIQTEGSQWESGAFTLMDVQIPLGQLYWEQSTQQSYPSIPQDGHVIAPFTESTNAAASDPSLVGLDQAALSTAEVIAISALADMQNEMIQFQPNAMTLADAWNTSAQLGWQDDTYQAFAPPPPINNFTLPYEDHSPPMPAVEAFVGSGEIAEGDFFTVESLHSALATNEAERAAQVEEDVTFLVSYVTALRAQDYAAETGVPYNWEERAQRPSTPRARYDPLASEVEMENNRQEVIRIIAAVGPTIREEENERWQYSVSLGSNVSRVVLGKRKRGSDVPTRSRRSRQRKVPAFPDNTQGDADTTFTSLIRKPKKEDDTA